MILRRRGSARPKAMFEAGTDRCGLVVILCTDQSVNDLVRGLHGHATEVGNKMSTMSMASKTAF